RVSEGMAHGGVLGVGRGHRRPEGQEDRRGGEDVPADPQQVGGRSGPLRADGGRGEKQGERDEQQDGAGDELAHGSSGGGWENMPPTRDYEKRFGPPLPGFP